MKKLTFLFFLYSFFSISYTHIVKPILTQVIYTIYLIMNGPHLKNPKRKVNILESMLLSKLV